MDTFVQDPSIHAFDAVTGSILWEANTNQSFGATTLAGHVVFSSFLGLSESELPAIKAYAASAPGGKLLFVYPTQVNGQPGMVNSAVIPIGPTIFFGSGNFFDGSGSGIRALTLP